jgi:hypothetical protein
MSDPALDPCGCCAGLDAETPSRIDNAPGLPAVAYRIGTHAKFKESMLARLSSADLPALAGLGARDDADFTVALCDALATTLDVLTFYQERIANENFLRTATERRSILELARLIGYELAPGVAASTWLAFSLQEVPGSPALAAGPVMIPVGTRVQSVPGQDETAQTFETVEAVEARAEWNAIPVQTTKGWHPAYGDKSLWLAGVGTGLQSGDVILIVGQERLDDPGSERWDIRLVTQVSEDKESQRTRLGWKSGLGHGYPHIDPADAGAVVYAFRQRAALFGHNAPDPRLMGNTGGSRLDDVATTGTNRVWRDFQIQGSQIDLDAAYPKITPGSWIALVSNEGGSHASGLAGYVELYQARSVSYPSRRDYGLSGKVTRVEPDTDENLSIFRNRIRENLVLAQSELLVVAPTPLGYPLYGNTIPLSRLAPGILPGRTLAISGKRARVRLRRGQHDVTMALDEGGSVTLSEGDSLRLAAPPEKKSGSTWASLPAADFAALIDADASTQLRLALLDRDDRQGLLTITAAAIEQAPAAESDDEVHEIVFIDTLPTAVSQDRDRSFFVLSGALKYCYDRETATVNANVAHATHGETVSEIVGSGDARVANASFILRQSPLTYVSAATPGGRRSTLKLRANEVLWSEVPSLYGHTGTERAYELRLDDAGRTRVQFGDGVEGARPPSGDHNIRAEYRKGLGLAGKVAAGKLTTLLSRPLGVAGATNPEAAGGGEDAEHEDKARTNAPLTVLTLDRAVSVRDYRDFARAFPGIAKAHALWSPSGPGRGVFLTVAGEEGAAVPEGGDTHRHLQDSLHSCGDPLMAVHIVSYRDARFALRLTVKAGADADATLVLPAVAAALKSAFGFDARSFGQSVSVDEVAAVAQNVGGVDAIQILELHRRDTPLPAFVPRIFSALPVDSLTTLPLAAELLVLDETALTVEPMP